MSQVRLQEKKFNRALWPVIGFILAVALGAIAWMLQPTVITFLRRTSPRVREAVRDLPDWQVEVLVAFIIFILLAVLAALIVAVLSPKKKAIVKDIDLVKERKAILLEHKRDKVRQRYVNQQYRESVEKRNRD